MTQLRVLLACSLLLLLSLLSAPAAAASWWDGKWNYRAKIDLNTNSAGAAMTEPGGRAQVLVRLHSGNFNFADAKEDGSDVRFIAADDRTPLKYHFEKYDGLVDQVALAWVDVPKLDANASSSVFVYFGNPEATPGSDPKGSYDADNVAVFHFANQGAAGTDTTAYGNNAQAPLTLAETALIGSGLQLDGKAPVKVPASASLNLAAAQPLTLSAWIKPAGANASGVIASLPGALTLLIEQGVVYAEAGGVRTSAGAPLVGEGWAHLAVRVDAGKLAVYVNGAPAGEAAIAQFHLAIGVHDLQTARAFYCDVLGAGQGRSTKNLIDLDFYGHHLVIHQAPQEAVGDAAFGSAFYGETVKVPHFGINLNWRDWSALAERIKRHGYEFVDPPHVRMRDLPGEHATMFLNDPSGNALEFKAFRNHDEVFATIFASHTREMEGLDGLVEKAAAA